MKKCAIIICYVNNEYRKDLLKSQVKFFSDLGIDPVIVSSDHIDKIDGAKNYLTIKHVSEEKYITDSAYSYISIENVKYFKADAYTNISAKSFFIKLLQCTFAYCKNLGYDFFYVLDFDNLIHKDHIPVAFNTNLDLSKVYFYTVGNPHEYQGAFFYGNLDVATQIFSSENLKYLENFAKEQYVDTNERAYFILANNFKNSLTVMPHTAQDLYSKRNMFSSRNVANIFYDSERKEYWFLQYKGDTCENEFACELFLENTIIYSKHLKYTGNWSLLKLEDNKNYKIKYYDNEISNLTLSKTSNIYTDTNAVTTPNWIQRT